MSKDTHPGAETTLKKWMSQVLIQGRDTTQDTHPRVKDTTEQRGGSEYPSRDGDSRGEDVSRYSPNTVKKGSRVSCSQPGCHYQTLPGRE